MDRPINWELLDMRLGSLSEGAKGSVSYQHPDKLQFPAGICFDWSERYHFPGLGIHLQRYALLFFQVYGRMFPKLLYYVSGRL